MRAVPLIARWGGLVLVVATAALLGFVAGRASAPEPTVRHDCAPTASRSAGGPVVVTVHVC